LVLFIEQSIFLNLKIAEDIKGFNNAELDDAKEIVKLTFEEFGDDSDMDPNR